MRLVADLQIHSKYSRAVSPKMVLENLDKWAKIKGIHILGTGDLTHPKWIKEIKEKLEPAEPGLFKLKNQYKVDSFGRLDPVRSSRASGPEGTRDYVASATSNGVDGGGEPRFMLTGEVSLIYSKGGKARRVHHMYLVPTLDAAEKMNQKLSFVGNLASDGRPIMGLDSKEFLKICLEASPDIMIIPAHAWTPWFSIFGSKSGFDSVEECFDELSEHIYALETGLSSDPKMNWRLSALDKYALVSNSDSHSLHRIGREANVFDTELDYYRIIEAIKSKGPDKFLYTIEFFPEEGKYHYDGHRLCKVSFSPEESKKHNLKCPVCRASLTIGVLARVDQLADRAEGFKPQSAIPYKNMVPLDQIIADALSLGESTKAVWAEYEKLVRIFGNEFNILFEASREELDKATLPQIAEGIKRVREGKLHIEPGYDGEYGKVKIFTPEERESISKQASLF